jgi:hypothetical protein
MFFAQRIRYNLEDLEAMRLSDAVPTATLIHLRATKQAEIDEIKAEMGW